MAAVLKGKEGKTTSEASSPVRAPSRPQPLSPVKSISSSEPNSLSIGAGNQAIQRFVHNHLQTKLTASSSRDSLETEADRTAEEIVAGAPAVSIKTEGPGEKVHTKERVGQTPLIDNRAAAQIAALHGGGEPLSSSLQSFYETRFRKNFGRVRIHTNRQAADLAASLHSRAFTIGEDIVFGAGEYEPLTMEGRALLAHEMTHVVQQLQSAPVQSEFGSAVSLPAHPAEIEANRISGQVGATSPITASPKSIIHRDDTDPNVSEAPIPNTGTFVLDPSIAGLNTPDHMTTHVRIQQPLAVGTDYTFNDRYVELERPVRSARRIVTFAIPQDVVFDTSIEASTVAGMITERTSRPAPEIGAQAFTFSAAFTVTDVRDKFVFTETPNREAMGAGAVILLETDSGTVLIDAGLQLNDPTLAGAVGDELAKVVIADLGQTAISEAILMPKPPNGYALPFISNQVRLLSVRATKDQYDQGDITEILRGQTEYRKWYESSLREQLTAGRLEWENTQPIAPNNSIRDERWNAHLEQEMASAISNYQPPRLFLAEQAADSNLKLKDEEITQGPPSDVGAVPDLSQTEWVPADDQQIIIYGNGRVTLVPSIGILLKPAATPQVESPVVVTPPQPEPITGIRPAEPLGLSAAVPRPITPWMALATVGKEMHLIVRLSDGLGILVDAGGPRAMTIDGFTQLSTRLGVVSIEKILVTHPHFDHVRYLLELIEQHHIKAEDLVVSKSWIDTGPGGKERIVEALRTTTKKELVDLGYGQNWTEPGIAVPAEGVTKLHITAGQSQIDVFARGAAHQEYQAQRRDVRQGRKKSMPSNVADSASFLYVFGNESSPNRTAVMGDFRGEDIVEMQRTLGEAQFAEAFKNVRVIKGVGHHFSETAGRTPTDIRGLNLLLEATLGRYGELTILVQSSEGFAFGGAATSSGPEGALLRYFTQQGVKVVFAGRSVDGGGSAVVSSNVQVTTHGTGVQVLEGADPRVVEMHRRLELLREARSTVTRSAEFGPTALGLPQRKGAELQQALDTEIQRLEGLARELRGHAAVELLESRGPADSTLTGPQRTERQTFKAESVTAGRTVEQIMVEMAQPGPVESSLSETVRTQLRGAMTSGRSIAVELELAATPRAVLEAIEQLPEARRSSLAQKYREMAELTKTLEADVIPDAQRLKVLLAAKTLRNELNVALEEAGATRPPALEAEAVRLKSVVEQLEAQTVRQEEIGRDVEGRVTRTEYVKIQGNDLLQRGFHSLGRAMGAVMVVHSVTELGGVAQDVALGKANLPETMLRVTHSVYGMNIGVRMARTTYSQLTAGTGAKVGAWEFGLMAVIEIGAAVAADYKTSEERDAAILGTAIHSSINLLCMYVGQIIMDLSAKFLVHPIAKLVGMGIGLAIMMAGEKIISFLGLDDDIARWTQFPPGEVTDVNLKINKVLDDYKILIGSQEIQKRSPEELTDLGAVSPYSLIVAAEKTETNYASAVQSKEAELTGLFESAYDRTRGSFAGIQMLDQQAAEFLRLRGLAMGGRYDPQREDLDKRWRAMDQRLDLSGATAETIKDMEQWKKLDNKLTELESELAGSKLDPDSAFENLDEAQQMIANARYRLDPRIGGHYRTKPLIPEGTEAYRVYREMLLERETRLAGFHQALLRFAGHDAKEPIFQYTQVDPRTAFVRLRTIANAYRQHVVELSAQFPNLTKPETWATPGEFARQVEKANREHPVWFMQLRLAEKTLESATRQASSALLLASPPPDATLRKLLEDEIEGAIKAMEQRRTWAGLIFLTELDAILEKRGADEDKILASELRAAYPTQKSCKAVSEPAPFTETEIAATQTASFKAVGAEQLTSNEQQLAEVRKVMAPVRQYMPGVDAMRDWNKLSRVVDRRYYILANPFKQWDPNAKIDFVDEHSYDPSLTPIVAILWDWAVVSLYYGTFSKVIPINADAVRLLGRGESLIQPKGGRIIKEKEILEEARKNQVQ